MTKQKAKQLLKEYQNINTFGWTLDEKIDLLNYIEYLEMVVLGN